MRDLQKTCVPYNNNFSVCLRDKGSNNERGFI